MSLAILVTFLTSIFTVGRPDKEPVGPQAFSRRLLTHRLTCLATTDLDTLATGDVIQNGSLTQRLPSVGWLAALV